MTFSVLTSIYKNESASHLQEALSSIWDVQRVKPAEIVLVKDGPLTSSLEDVINNWKLKLGPNLRILTFTENRGLGAAL